MNFLNRVMIAPAVQKIIPRANWHLSTHNRFNERECGYARELKCHHVNVTMTVRDRTDEMLVSNLEKT